MQLKPFACMRTHTHTHTLARARRRTHTHTHTEAKMENFFSEWIENIVGKEENAGHWNFLVFPKCF